MPAIVVKSYAQCQREYAELCARLAEDAFRKACRNNYARLYLIGSKRAGLDTLNPSASVWERFSIATEAEADARPELEYVRPEPLPAHSQTIEHLTATVREWLNREPLAIFAG